MIPELASVISKVHTPCEGEICHLECLSPSQINSYLQDQITRIQKQSIFFPKIQKKDYYVILGKEESDVEIIEGRHMLSFSIVIPTRDELVRVVSKTVPREDVVAFAVELEEIFKHEVKVAQIKILEYERRLSCLHELAALTKEAILSLIRRTYERKVFLGLKVLVASLLETRTLYAPALTDCEKQLAVLTAFFRTKDSS